MMVCVTYLQPIGKIMVDGHYEAPVIPGRWTHSNMNGSEKYIPEWKRWETEWYVWLISISSTGKTENRLIYVAESLKCSGIGNVYFWRWRLLK